ncbi:hypothetical protein TEA_001126 [Camellia sinensis var. sinensis]|uniref:C2 domain-containing protein n=1 Tax=Camellia sinensis var. sinensis TaxID=542762 RepID=A0A4S4DB45_CAMSN|nr:hypothetical protein TEA_001126 [Camellia sinensis var. sinensis]
MESMPKPSLESDDKLHIVMLPWLAFGHMIPFLELSKLIAQKGHTVSFVSTPRNIDKLPKMPQKLASLINLVKLQLPQVKKLPENTKSTTDLPYDKVKYLKMAYDQLQQPMTQLLADMAPDWVIYDFAPYWLGPVAAKLGISRVCFSIFIAATLCFAGPIPVLKGEDDRTAPEDFTATPKWIPFKSNIACFQLFEVKCIFDDVASVDYENIPATYRFGAGIEACDVLAKPIIPIGLLPTTTYDSSDNGEAWTEIKEWLNKQAKRPVVYVAFGSEAKPNQAELTEIALGLELSELPFFWVLRNWRGVADAEVIELPNGFEERTKERGVVCTSWAPQLKILSHDLVGGFLSHSRLSSVVEAIQFTKPLILLSSLADTGLIARLLEEKRTAYLILREEQDGSFTRDSVADSLRLVIVEDEGRIYKEKVKEMSGLQEDRPVELHEREVTRLRSEKGSRLWIGIETGIETVTSRVEARGGDEIMNTGLLVILLRIVVPIGGIAVDTSEPELRPQGKLTVTVKTEVIDNDLNPIWNQTFELIAEDKETQSLILELEGVVTFFGRVAILIDQNTQAFHMFITALLQLLDRSGLLYGELARFVLRLLGIRAKPKKKAIVMMREWCYLHTGKALMSIKASFSNIANVLLDWDVVHNDDFYSWRGVFCDNVTLSIVSLDFQGNKLTGQIPDEIGNCVSLMLV